MVLESTHVIYFLRKHAIYSRKKTPNIKQQHKLKLRSLAQIEIYERYTQINLIAWRSFQLG